MQHAVSSISCNLNIENFALSFSKKNRNFILEILLPSSHIPPGTNVLPYV